MKKKKANLIEGESDVVRLVAAIDIGATSVRMLIAGIDEGSGDIRRIDSLHQAVDLGRDAFTRGYIRKETTERCVEILRSFQEIMAEYRITEAKDIKAVATSAVREAVNREAFLDRLYIATGIDVEDIDEAEVTRYVYLAVKPVLDVTPGLSRGTVLLTEVGGGSTEFLVIRRGQVVFAHTYRLGAVRIRELLDDVNAPVARIPDILENEIHNSIERIQHSVSLRSKPKMLAVGGDIRFAAQRIMRGWDGSGVAEIKLSDLDKLCRKILAMSQDEIVRKFGLTYQEAETLGPALLSYARLAGAMRLEKISVASTSLRDGLVVDLASDAWSNEFSAQVLQSARKLAKQYDEDIEHAEHVTRLALQLFRALKDEHRLHERYELILRVAGLLHDIGTFISAGGHHKHSMYLIQNSEIFGLGARERNLIAQVAQYHRRSEPKQTHPDYMALDRESRIAVAKLSAILRVADALDRSHACNVGAMKVLLEPGQVSLVVPDERDLTIEELGLQQKGQMFERVYGLRIIMVPGDVI